MSARETLDHALVALAADGRRPRCGEHADRDLWTSDSVDDRRKAAQLCTRCPVLYACAEAAEEADERHHTWAGKDRTRHPNKKEKTK